ncbi:hypothetical protein ONR57_08185 [Hoyosella sp. YIM 151337]|uniref:hypothetical protein n=1 Tax=Hoyosella sp. YIM 151337 TaxID=2992742 RepID=UPI002235A555|nr:hypothetical protein [Hoyosella sp. YIM 151337]MCW4353272.1 hypothetical protein [Hoyosella sp. YIM 151337]
MTDNGGERLDEEPQEERGEPGSRDKGTTGPGGGPVDRPAGSFDDKEMQSATDDEPTQ